MGEEADKGLNSLREDLGCFDTPISVIFSGYLNLEDIWLSRGK